ncbi:hypothetical protein [Tenacibaculum crassostreae]|uniref:hypothetical protein n=1 Tax=Tenacibaculum crassostreae TaxID=502683 RepID=UPI00389378D6
MKNLKKELQILRVFAICTIGLMTAFVTVAFKNGTNNQKFGTIDVERINIVEKDGTVKMVITNVQQFPNGKDTINNRPVNEDRKKRSGMLFFNEDGIECGGFIYDGTKTKDGHSAGMSLSFDQYDGDQVMQLLATDKKRNGKRYKTGGLIFNDRPDKETQLGISKIHKELDAIKDRKLRRKKRQEYIDKGLLGGAPRIYLGQTGSKNNGLFLFDKEGRRRANFYIDKNNNVKLEAYDEKGKVVSTWPK